MKARYRVLFPAVALLLTAALCRPSHAQRKEYERQWHEVTLNFETPHTRWARPLHGGRIRALFIAPRPCLRDVAELAQRLDLDFDVLPAYMSGSLGWITEVGHTHILGFSPEDRKRQLAQKLAEPWDVIAVGNIEWKILPLEAQYQLLRKVKDGTGLVLSYYDKGRNEYLDRFLKAARPVQDDGYVTASIPLRFLPAWEEFKSDEEALKKAVDLREFGKGRVVLMKYPSRARNSFLVPRTATSELFHVDYYFALAAKAVAWAARRDSPPRPSRFGLCKTDGTPVEEIARENLSTVRILLQFERADRNHPGRVCLKVRDDRGREVLARTVRLSETLQPKTLSIGLPVLREGTYYVDAVARSGERSLNWCARAFKVASEQNIAELKTDRPTLKPGEKLNVTAILAKPAKEAASVRFTATDSLGRVVFRKDVRVEKGRKDARVGIQLARPCANLLYVDAELFDGGGPVSLRRVAQPVCLFLPRDDFGFLVWLGEDMEYPWRWVRKILYDHGVDTSNIGQGPVLATANIHPCTYATRIACAKKTKVPNVRVPCLTDPKYREAERKKLVAAAEVVRLYGPTGYSLGDENYLSTGEEFCFSDTCKAYFRRYLQSVYKDLAALNREWETQYKRWEDVEPITLIQARKAKREGAFAQWADHRMCMEVLWTDIHEFDRKAIRSVDPGARIGDEGSFSTTSYSGYDWWKLSKVMDVWNIYPSKRHVIEMIRSFGMPHTYSGTWYGGYVGWSRWESRERWIPWYSALHGLTAAWWFKAYSFSTEQCQEDAIAADLTPFPCFLWSVEEITALKRGFGKLLLNCKRDNYGVAILYSQRSVHATTIDTTYDRVPRALLAAIDLVEDLGLQHDIVSYDQLADGTVRKRGYRVLIMPCCQAMSAQEKKAAVDFVKAGGCLIADVRPGIRDGHCKLVEDADWLDFLGVRFGAPATKQVAEVRVDGRLKDRPVAAVISDLTADSSVELRGAVPLGKAADVVVGLVKEHGAGRVVLLNFPFAGYAQKAKCAPGVRALVEAVLQSAGVERQVVVEAWPGPIFQGEVITYTDGAALYVALLRDESQDIPRQSLRVKLPAGFEVYDSRAGRYLGRRDEVRLTMTEGTAAVYALLPYRVESVAVQAPRSVGKGGTVHVSVMLSARDAKPGRHIVRLDVYAPGDKLMQHYGRNLELKGGRASTDFDLALNDPEGQWTLTARDVATGARSTVELDVTR